ncbi:hypothetical protein KBC85_03060 [Candidatus Saccharibacteria bacterium]|nr:hypothetical protein [Candidatus Saccharibacteria bacterium]
MSCNKIDSFRSGIAEHLEGYRDFTIQNPSTPAMDEEALANQERWYEVTDEMARLCEERCDSGLPYCILEDPLVESAVGLQRVLSEFEGVRLGASFERKKMRREQTQDKFSDTDDTTIVDDPEV